MMLRLLMQHDFHKRTFFTLMPITMLAVSSASNAWGLL
jgi:hypothetical protein